ncbi:MAG: hypothetical protein N3E37_02360 [Candidatus Micrarchaeota archaeon]|nr:hypothetical protein [Candidatus Micrarchaeota archaeon]
MLNHRVSEQKHTKTKKNFRTIKPIIDKSFASSHQFWKELCDTKITPRRKIKRIIYSNLASLEKKQMIRFLTDTFEVSDQRFVNNQSCTQVFVCNSIGYLLYHSMTNLSSNAKTILLQLIELFRDDPKTLYHIFSESCFFLKEVECSDKEISKYVRDYSEAFYDYPKSLLNCPSIFKKLTKILSKDTECLLHLLTKKFQSSNKNNSYNSIMYTLLTHNHIRKEFCKINRYLSNLLRDQQEAKLYLINAIHEVKKDYFLLSNSLQTLRIYYDLETIRNLFKEAVKNTNIFEAASTEEIFYGFYNALRLFHLNDNYDDYLIKFFRDYVDTQTLGRSIFVILDNDSLIESKLRLCVNYLKYIKEIMLVADEDKFLEAITSVSASGERDVTWNESFIGQLFMKMSNDEIAKQVFMFLINMLSKHNSLNKLLNKTDILGNSFYDYFIFSLHYFEITDFINSILKLIIQAKKQ